MGLALELDHKAGSQTGHVETVEKVSCSSSPSGIDADRLDELNTIEETPSGKFVWLVTITASWGGLLFGKAMSVIQGMSSSANISRI
jgi:MFS transporter, SP family, solute carrier family 2 (myo-inositol transporter), member 13